jgi:histidinol dehydrogenase
MTILTAKVAGARNVIGYKPPIAGKFPNATIAAMHYAVADEIFVLGRVQAIAAMALGTDNIAEPENAEGKPQFFSEFGINQFTGPTEVLVVADNAADPYTVTTDLLS